MIEEEAAWMGRGQPVTAPRRRGPEPRGPWLAARRLAGLVPLWVLRDVLLPFAVTRTTLLLVAVISLSITPNPLDPATFHGLLQKTLKAWTNWDAEWYLRIARDGYLYAPGQYSNVVFFPLLPLLMRFGAWLLGQENVAGWVVSGIAITNLALIVAAAYLIALMRLDFDEAIARRAAVYLLIFPTSFFLSAVYADALLLLGCVAAFYHARRGQWWVAGAFGAAAALSRPHGVFVAPPLAFEYLAQRRFDPRQIRPDVLALGLVPAGMLSYLGFLGWRFGNPLAFLDSYSAWGRSTGTPWETMAQYFAQPLVVHGNYHSLVDLGFTALFVTLVALSWRYVRPSQALFGTVLLLVMISSGTIASLMRYGLTLYPAFVVLALAGRSTSFDRGYFVWATGLGSLFLMMYLRSYWVA
ncbi:MAG: hypothetical protein HY329_01515 [Chloroflexi bacterium]|nr:hypothetical protein [Chloroflexota bacterium]